MARTMYDSTTAADIPADAEVVAGYMDGAYDWSIEDWHRFPNAILVAIFTNPNTPIGQYATSRLPGDVAAIVLDVEQGDATPADVPGWAQKAKAAGWERPIVYCSASIADQIMGNGAGLWVADWTGQPHQFAPWCAATQYDHPPTSGGHYDLSLCADNWPTSEVTLPPIVNYPGDTLQAIPVIVQLSGGHGWIPCPVPANKVVSVTVNDENPDAVGRYDTLPTFVGVATQPGTHSPNGALMFAGPDGTFGCTIWTVT